MNEAGQKGHERTLTLWDGLGKARPSWKDSFSSQMSSHLEALSGLQEMAFSLTHGILTSY